MDRKVFLKNSLGFLGMAVAVPSLLKANSAGQADPADSCTVSPTETAGPFPTINPANWSRTDITDGRTGIPLSITINLKNVNGNCSALENAIIDIWHCDKDGNYSEYGGSGMQQTNYTSVHFLRGRQVSGSNGMVGFTSIFPGWYTGRATHIHVHIYSATGASLLITQIAFPEGTNSAVAQVNASSENGYTKGMNGYTYNASDNVFNNDTIGAEIAQVTGSVANGYALEHTIFVNGPTLGTNKITTGEYMIQQNYPNPFTDATTIPLNLEYASDVDISLYDITGRKVLKVYNGTMAAGVNNVALRRNNLQSGHYIYTVIIKNPQGTFKESKKMIIR